MNGHCIPYLAGWPPEKAFVFLYEFFSVRKLLHQITGAGEVQTLLATVSASLMLLLWAIQLKTMPQVFSENYYIVFGFF